MNRLGIVVTAIASVMAFSQTPVRDGAAIVATGTSTLGGVVVADDPGARPLRRAIVTLNATDTGVARTTISGDDGRFVFSALPAGRFSLVASKAAYVTTYYGNKRPGRGPAVPIPLADGQSLTNVTLRIMRGAVITGHVVDPSGRPAMLASISAVPVRALNGGRAVGSQPRVSALTDESGAYRIFGLSPGDYVVSATMQLGGLTQDVRATSAADLQRAQLAIGSARAGTPGAPPSPPPAETPRTGYATVYYPGTADFTAAAAIAVGPGEQRTDVDVRMVMVRLTAVDGAVVSSDGRPFGDAMVVLTSSGPMGSSGSGVQANQKTGAFAFRNMVPGQYTLIARALPAAVSGAPPPAPLWSTMDFTFDGRDVHDLALSMQPGATVGGRVVVERSGATPPLDLSRVRVNLAGTSTAGRAFGFGAPAQQPDASGAFAFANVAPGQYRLTTTVQNAGPLPVWTQKSAALNGRDVADLPVDIRAGESISNATVTLTDRVTELSGLFRDAAGAPTTDFMVVVFSADRRYWTTGSRRVVGPVRPGADGRFVVRDLPPGDYLLAAADDVEEADLADAAFLEALAAKAIRITLAEGEKKTQDVKVSGGVAVDRSRRAPFVE